MKLQIVSFELAKKLKEIGFDVSLNEYYSSRLDKEPTKANLKRDWNGDFKQRIPNLCTAPTQALAQMWFWKAHKLWIEITLWDNYFVYVIKEDRGDGIYSLVDESSCGGPYKDEVKALEAGLLKACEIIKERNFKSSTPEEYENKDYMEDPDNAMFKSKKK